MTNLEFSNEFDTLLNSYPLDTSYKPVNLDEYEKSVFLTKAQEEIVISTYAGNNYRLEGFDNTEEYKKYLNTLIKQETINCNNQFDLECLIPEDLWFITYEEAKLFDYNKNKQYTALVVPTEIDDFYKINKNPFRGPSNLRILRLDSGKNKVRLISKLPIQSYYLEYLKKPQPIILEDLPENLTINNINEETPCELNPIIHRRVLDRAVQLVLLSKNIGITNK